MSQRNAMITKDDLAASRTAFSPCCGFDNCDCSQRPFLLYPVVAAGLNSSLNNAALWLPHSQSDRLIPAAALPAALLTDCANSLFKDTGPPRLPRTACNFLSLLSGAVSPLQHHQHSPRRPAAAGAPLPPTQLASPHTPYQDKTLSTGLPSRWRQ